MSKKVSKKTPKAVEKKPPVQMAKPQPTSGRYAAGVKTVWVKPLCNMQLRDGGVLDITKAKCEISEKEMKRLEDDSRGDFFEKL